ncbi:alanyl-tRNA editing protein [Rhodobacter sp. Har01]|uniref:alanyl-tRNA editing protein n=1 Tax=Rhodobacter sp. Har01 TaxID=2883999 RepID=UPI001D07F6BA|nr:alanyl-tRNA editing protein [Rhodobacter sp. Har01]MCB6176579.1 alanyl-tRNA editing protein [Rhodobacter sp. Har01]
MTDLLYRADPYLQEAPARVTGHTPEGGIVLDRSLFYPTGGGQPGDSGWLVWDGGRLAIATTVKAEGGVALVPAEPLPLPPVGAEVRQRLDWTRRYRHMRVHTALHLLSVVIPLPVTGGQVGADRGRLDFDMPEPPDDVPALEAALNALIERDLKVTESWITDAELAANPGLVKTLSVMPPVGQGRVRLIRIGAGEDQVDLQPCGGTHVARTAEIGRVEIDKIEKKGRMNRRVSLTLAD